MSDLRWGDILELTEEGLEAWGVPGENPRGIFVDAHDSRNIIVLIEGSYTVVSMRRNHWRPARPERDAEIERLSHDLYVQSRYAEEIDNLPLCSQCRRGTEEHMEMLRVELVAERANNPKDGEIEKLEG